MALEIGEGNVSIFENVAHLLGTPGRGGVVAVARCDKIASRLPLSPPH